MSAFFSTFEKLILTNITVRLGKAPILALITSIVRCVSLSKADEVTNEAEDMFPVYFQRN